MLGFEHFMTAVSSNRDKLGAKSVSLSGFFEKTVIGNGILTRPKLFCVSRLLGGAGYY